MKRILALSFVAALAVAVFSVHDVSAQTSQDNGLTTYASSSYGFAIKYPQGWQVNENPTNPRSIVVFSDQQGNNAVSVDEKQFDITQSSLKAFADTTVAVIQKVLSGTSVLEEESVTINDHDAYFIEYSLPSGDSTVITKIFFVAADSNDVYTITCVTADKPYEASLNQFNDIASSFTITGSSPSSIQNTQQPSSQPNPNTSVPQSSSQQPGKVQIPSWVKTNAKWWSEGQVGDSDFTKGIQYLIQQGIMQIPPTNTASSQSSQIPSWVKTNAKWWSQGQISDDDFVKGIQYLVSNGIINVNPSQQEQPQQPQQTQQPSQLPQQQSSGQGAPAPKAGGWQVLQESICYQAGGCNVGSNAFDVLDINADGTWSFGGSSGKWSVSQTTSDDANAWSYALADPSSTTSKFPYKITLDGWNGGSATGPLEISSDNTVNFIWLIYPYAKSTIGPALIVMKFYLPSQTG